MQFESPVDYEITQTVLAHCGLPAGLRDLWIVRLHKYN